MPYALMRIYKNIVKKKIVKQIMFLFRLSSLNHPHGKGGSQDSKGYLNSTTLVICHISLFYRFNKNDRTFNYYNIFTELADKK